jgi:hypothetical protein
VDDRWSVRAARRGWFSPDLRAPVIRFRVAIGHVASGETRGSIALEDMRARNLSPQTQRAYVETVTRFARHCGRSPALLGPVEIRAYRVYLTQGIERLQLNAARPSCLIPSDSGNLAT